MRFQHPLDEIFHGRSSVRVLRALHELPDGLAVSGRDLARRAGISHPTATAVLRSLASQGLVLVQRSPRTDGFSINRDHVLAPAVTLLLEREQGLDDEVEEFIRSQLKGRGLRLRGALLFGSVAEGRATETSDIDLAVLCRPEDEEATYAALEEVADAVRLRFGNRLNVVMETDSLDKLKRGPGSRLWRTILQQGRPVLKVTDERRRRA